MTPRRLILQAAALFREHGVPDPVYDAAELLSYVTKQPPLLLRLDDDTEVAGSQEETFRSLCSRRAARIPLQHLLGTAWFFGREFAVSPDALIPRPETELLIHRAKALVSELISSVGCAALDLCCGSGCIAVTLVLETRFVVTASDISKPALELTKRNALRHSAVVKTACSDLLDGFLQPDSERFALIVSNPPYIPSDVCDNLQPEVMRDPRLALDGGADGLDFYRRIAADAPNTLLPGGVLLLEIGSDQGEAVRSLLSAAGFGNIRVFKDDAGLDRAVEAHLPHSLQE